MNDLLTTPLPYLFAIFAAVMVFSIAGSRKRRALEIERARKDEHDARLRGWKLETTGVGSGLASYVFSGTTDGIEWRFHTGRQQVATGRVNRTVPNPPSRWETESVRLESGSIQIWPSRGAELEKIKSFDAPQFILQMILRPLANALGGSAEDIQHLIEGDVVSLDPALAQHYLMRATDPDRARRFLESGAREELASAATWFAADEINPMILIILWPRGLTILSGGKIYDLERIQKLIRLGTALAHAGMFK